MRQAITARRLANSPPAPSPSKKPKRAGPQLTPKELAKLAKKQLGTLRKLLDGTGRPYPAACGVDRPVGEIIKFVKKAHSAWMTSVSRAELDACDVRLRSCVFVDCLESVCCLPYHKLPVKVWR